MRPLQRRRGVGSSGLWVPGPGDNGSDIHQMPTGNLPNWRLVFTDNFAGYNYPIGTINPTSSYPGVTGPAALDLGLKWGFYGNNVRTTHDGKVYPILSNEPGYQPPNPDGSPSVFHPPVVSKYWPTKTVSFVDGKARIYQHSQIINGVQTALGAVIRPKVFPDKYLLGPYLKYRFRTRHTEVIVNGVDQAAIGNYTTGPTNHFHTVPLAIDSDTWNENHWELDFPEHETNRKVAGNHHPKSATNVTQHFEPSPAQSPYEWHVPDIEWTPNRIQYSLNGTPAFTSTTRIGDNPVVVVGQHEANWRQPPAGFSSVTEYDWFAVWMWDPTTTGSEPAGFGLGAFGTSPFGV